MYCCTALCPSICSLRWYLLSQVCLQNWLVLIERNAVILWYGEGGAERLRRPDLLGSCQLMILAMILSKHWWKWVTVWDQLFYAQTVASYRSRKMKLSLYLQRPSSSIRFRCHLHPCCFPCSWTFSSSLCPAIWCFCLVSKPLNSLATYAGNFISQNSSTPSSTVCSAPRMLLLISLSLP